MLRDHPAHVALVRPFADFPLDDLTATLSRKSEDQRDTVRDGKLSMKMIREPAIIGRIIGRVPIDVGNNR
jgi:hypothetical protein